jgi:lysozyme family protein
MANFALFFPILLENEGYYSNVQGDTGGETWEGISRNNFPNWKGWEVIDSYKENENFPHILRSDNNLQQLVESFYKPEFWDIIKGDEILNQSLANFIADFGVNSGISIPIKHVQQILGVDVDGKIGPATLQALNSVSEPDFFNELKQARIKFYHDVVSAHPSDEKFLSNWLERTNSFIYKA